MTLLVSQLGPPDDHVFLVGRPPLLRVSWVHPHHGSLAARLQIKVNWRHRVAQGQQTT